MFRLWRSIPASLGIADNCTDLHFHLASNRRLQRWELTKTN